ENAVSSRQGLPNWSGGRVFSNQNAAVTYATEAARITSALRLIVGAIGQQITRTVRQVLQNARMFNYRQVIVVQAPLRFAPIVQDTRFRRWIGWRSLRISSPEWVLALLGGPRNATTLGDRAWHILINPITRS